MKKIYFIIIFLILLIGYLLLPDSIIGKSLFKTKTTYTTSTNTLSIITDKKVNLSVPFVPEAPGTKWIEPWYNGCEEATIVMVEQFYLGKQKLTNSESQKLMLKLFAYQNKHGYRVDLDAVETEEIINNFTSFRATIKRNPTIEEIKAELHAGYPVIALLDGEILYNKLYGNGYHLIVIKGYDDDKQTFITNDDGNSKVGHNKLYSYATIKKALRDFNHETKKVDQPPTVIFTRPTTDKLKK
ncbi:MAG: C39 family peptidase [bacterium]|nr:C39 family peptidase [bacterium]